MFQGRSKAMYSKTGLGRSPLQPIKSGHSGCTQNHVAMIMIINQKQSCLGKWSFKTGGRSLMTEVAQDRFYCRMKTLHLGYKYL